MNMAESRMIYLELNRMAILQTIVFQALVDQYARL